MRCSARQRLTCIAISSVSGSRISGSIDVWFDNGQGYKAGLDVPVCPVSINVCSLLALCLSHTCVQP